MHLRIAPPLILFACLTLLGCGGPTYYEVSGKVTCDGEPIDMGEIVFESTEPGGGVDARPISKGEYRVKVKKGTCIVRINATKEYPLPAGEKTPWGSTKERKQFLPAKYNAESDTKIEVTGPMKRDFELTTKQAG